MQTLVVIVAFVATVGSGHFLDTSRLANASLVEYDNRLAKILTVFAEIEKLQDEFAELFAEMKSEGTAIRQDVETFMRHPLNQLSFMNRYAVKWTKMRALAEKIRTKKQHANELKPQHDIRHEEDLGQDFLRDLVDVYGLDVKNFSRDLTPDDCVGIGLKSFVAGKHSLCADWLKEALRKMRLGEKAAYTEALVSKSVLEQSALREIPDTASSKLYKDLCRRESTQASDEQTNLKCFDGRDGELRFDSTKIEILSQDPDIVLYHGLIPRQDAERMRGKVALGSAASNIYNLNLSDSAGDEDELVTNTRLRIAAVKGIRIENVQRLTVLQNKRRFRSFFTGFQPFDSRTNDFNFLLFLSDVEKGGAAVFEEPAVNVRPKSGDALVWDEGLKMAECPVLYGDKWSATLTAKPPKVPFDSDDQFDFGLSEGSLDHMLDNLKAHNFLRGF